MSMPHTTCVADRIVEIGEPLPPAIEGESDRLSPEGKASIRDMMGSDPTGYIATLATTWISIAAAIALAAWADQFLVGAAVVIFVGTRQNILGLLIHEQSHRLGLQSKSGDHVANLFAAFPLLITLEGYRRVHLKHHKFFFTDDDPDYARKQGKEWTFPQKARHFVLTLLKDAVGLNIARNFKGKRVEESGREHRGTPAWVRLALYAFVGLALSWAGWAGWKLFLLYWLLPLLTVMQVIVRFGAICEHKYNLIHPTMAQATPMIQPRWWERLLLPNLNFTLHIYHHWYPAIPFRKLPQVHRLFQREGLVNEANMFRGYVAFLRYLLTPGRAAAVESPSHRVEPSERRLSEEKRAA